jgi:hypothetical protein
LTGKKSTTSTGKKIFPPFLNRGNNLRKDQNIPVIKVNGAVCIGFR